MPRRPEGGKSRAPAPTVRLGKNTPDPSVPVPNEGLDRFQLLEKLGEGGMGTVYMAFDRTLRRTVAVKVIDRPQDSGLLAWLLREAEIAAQLDHPYIVPIYDLCRAADRRFYLVMKLVHGRPLSDVIHATRGEQAWDKWRTLYAAFLNICDAVAFAHSRGILHCDLKPANILMADFGQVYLMDWSISRMMARQQTPVAPGTPERIEAPIGFFGTPEFMSPEQALGLRQAIGERTDVFGLGAVLFAIATGESPYTGTLDECLARAETADVHLSRWPLPAGLMRILRKALDREPANRYPDVTSLKNDVEAFIQSHVSFDQRVYKTGDLIVAEGEIAHEAFILLRGSCRVYRTIDGQRRDLRRLEAGAVFGETAVLSSHGVRTASVEAAEDVVVDVVTRATLENGIDHPLGRFVRALADRFTQIEDRALAFDAELTGDGGGGSD